jgi:hypothetical protein
MQTTKHQAGAEALIELAARAGKLARDASREPEAWRIGGRLIASELTTGKYHVEALAEAHVCQARAGRDPLAGTPFAFFMLQASIAQVSLRRLQEDLWNEKHTHGRENGEGVEDVALRSVWRRQVRAILQECQQDAVFAMSSEEYAIELIDSGADDEAAEALVDWISDVLYVGEEL